jgi:NAD(P)-dependent dehydrogenase (short-subunit alcohol dehydrogenase family)
VKVAFTSRSRTSIDGIETAIRSTVPGAVIRGFSVDLTDATALDALPRRLAEAGFSPQALVNGARDIAHLTVDDKGRPDRTAWLGEYTLAVIVPHDLTLALADAPDSRLTSVVNLASIHGVTVPPNALYGEMAPLRRRPQYGSAKAAMIHMTRYLAVALAPQGIRVNSVSFGGVASTASAEFRQTYGALCPSGDMLSDGDIAGPVLFLCGQDSSGMTGHNLLVDGGWTTW